MNRSGATVRPARVGGIDLADERARAVTIIKKYGSDTLSYFALRDSCHYFFDETKAAFLSYKVWGNVALVGADPVGPGALVSPLIERFLRHCDSNRLTPCFLGISGDHLAVYQSHRLPILKIGEECLLKLQAFDVNTLKRKVRRAERHCLHLGFTSSMFTGTQFPESLRQQAITVSDEWIRARGGIERGFSMTLGRFPNREEGDIRIILALDGSRVIGLLTLMPVYGAGGWSLDMMRRTDDAPNGLTEFMIIQGAKMLRDEGFKYMSLNFAALSDTEISMSEPRAMRLLRGLVFNNFSWAFQMKTLYDFNAKFNPTWKSRYVAFRDLKYVGTMLAAIIQSEDPIVLPKFGALLRT